MEDAEGCGGTAVEKGRPTLFGGDTWGGGALSAYCVPSLCCGDFHPSRASLRSGLSYALPDLELAGFLFLLSGHYQCME